MRNHVNYYELTYPIRQQDFMPYSNYASCVEQMHL